MTDCARVDSESISQVADATNSKTVYNVVYFSSSLMPVERVSSSFHLMGDFAWAVRRHYHGLCPCIRALGMPQLALPFRNRRGATFLNVHRVAGVRKTWVVSACEGLRELPRDGLLLPGCCFGLSTGVAASLLADYATMWLLMRALYIVVTFAAMGKYVAIGVLRTPIFLTNIAVLTQMMMLAQAAYATAPVKKGFF